MTDDAAPPISEPEVSIEAIETIEDAWPAPQPSVGFAAGVLAAHFEDAQTPVEAPKRGRVWLGAVAAVVLVAGLLWGLRSGKSVEDQVEAFDVQTIALGERATAVAQPGTKMKWSVQSDGTTRIDQSSGRVFYRVDHGERFDVVTPAGTVTVTGTCFEVDLESNIMKTKARAGALGAVLASALVVTVYEGGVVLANDNGSVDLTAGQAGRVSDAQAPVRFDPDGPGGSDSERSGELASASNSKAKPGELAGDPMAHIQRQARDIERIREEKDAQAARIQELETEVLALGGSVDPKSPEAAKARAKVCASQSRGGACPFLEPDQDTLLEMARCATVKIDSLGFIDDPEPPAPGSIAERLGVTDPAEAEKLDAAAMQQYEDYHRDLKAMYLELGGEESTADDASGATLQSFILDQLDPELSNAIQRQISEERAGLREPPTQTSGLSIEERVSRLMANDGNEFERLVSDQLGAERARALRKKNDGWPGSTSVHSSDCVDPPPAPAP